jgi:hypothetical protein
VGILSSSTEFRDVQRGNNHPASILRLVPGTDFVDDFNTDFDKVALEVMAVLGDLEAALEELMMWKDDFLKQKVPSNIKLTLTLLFSKIFRSKSDLHEPLFDLIKKVRLYSKPWTEKQTALLELEKDHQQQVQVLDVAIRRIEYLESQIVRVKKQRVYQNWGKVVNKLMVRSSIH